MPSSREHRIARELQDIERDRDNSGVYACSVDGVRLDHLKGSFPGPPDSPYTGGTYTVDIVIPDQYPFKAPVMKFDTQIWHPNVSSQTGAICLDTLGTSWSPVNTIKTALLSLRMLLESPNPKDPQDAQVAKMMMEDPEYFNIMAHDWAVRHAGATRTMPRPSEYNRQEKNDEAQQDDPARYGGYSKNLVDRFAAMGFSVETVVEAFIHVGIERRDGADYEIELAYIGDVTAYLFHEP